MSILQEQFLAVTGFGFGPARSWSPIEGRISFSQAFPTDDTVTAPFTAELAHTSRTLELV